MAQSQTLTIDEANELVVAHQGWAESIARSVARAWNMDWRLDGLDGAAMEALLFCARRFDPSRGVPFKGYARKRIHEASTEAARKSRSWKMAVGSEARQDQMAREISAELFTIFPELRSGGLPSDEGGDDVRSSLRQLIVGASIVAAKQGISNGSPDDLLEYKRMIEVIASLDALHQMLLWKVYWEGLSMRSVATEWDTDELNIIREHKVLLEYLQKTFGKGKAPPGLKVRPGLKTLSIKVKKKSQEGPFTKLIRTSSGARHGKEDRR